MYNMSFFYIGKTYFDTTCCQILYGRCEFVLATEIFYRS